VATAGSVVVLAAVLALVARGHLPDVLVSGVGAVVVVATGFVRLDQVPDTIDRLGPTLVFLAAIFVLAEVARDAGLFDAAGALMARASGTSPRRLLLVVAAAAVVVTVVMSLDATAVLFTPVVVAVVRTRGAQPERPLLVTTQLAERVVEPVAGVEPHQAPRVLGHRAHLRRLRGADAAADRGGDRGGRLRGRPRG
jgi:arsenical pump membrane protein